MAFKGVNVSWGIKYYLCVWLLRYESATNYRHLFNEMSKNTKFIIMNVYATARKYIIIYR